MSTRTRPETTEHRLQRTLSDPVRKSEIADLFGVSITTIYASLKRFAAAKRAGDELAMRQEIPCLHFGGVPQKDGTIKGGRYVVPRDALIRFYVSASLDEDVLERLYGSGVAS